MFLYFSTLSLKEKLQKSLCKCQRTCNGSSKNLPPKKFFLFIYTNFFSLQNTNDTNAHLSSLISPSQQTALKEMSRVKIVKEAGAKPTDFENTVAKVRRSILTRSENRRGRGRVAVMYRREIQLARFCTRKWGSRVSARKKRRGREAELKKRARGFGFERRDACVARGTRSCGVSRIAMWSLDPERDFFFGS